MKAVIIEHPGAGTDAWKLVEREAPNPGPGELRVRIEAASINYRDLMVAKGLYGGPAKKGLVVLSDGAGVVDAVGPGATGFQVGDRVMGAYYPAWKSGPYDASSAAVGLGIETDDGVLAEHALLRADAVVRIPDRLSFEEAATLPCAALTAWQALFEGPTPLRPGATVLVQGTGGVSLFAAQLASAMGVRVIATTSSEAKAARLASLGIDDVVVRRDDSPWHDEVLRRTSGEGVDLVVDVGGSATLASSIASTRPGGRIALVGLLDGFGHAIDPLPILFRGVTVHGIHVGSVAMFRDLARALERTSIAPVIDSVVPLSEAPKALAKLARGEHFGKIVVRVR